MVLNITTGLDYDLAIASAGSDAIAFDSLPTAEISLLRTSSAPDAIFLLGGNDTANDNAEPRIYLGNEGLDSLYGNGGFDTLLGGEDSDVIDGGADDDVLAGNKGNDVITGGTGNDLIFGGKEEDALFGNEGNDSLSGDFGIDTLTGGEGADVFYLAASSAQGTDTIADFQDGIDKILLPDAIAFSNLQITDSGGSATIAIGGQPVALLNGIPAAALTSADFVGGVVTPPPTDPGNAPGNALDLGVLTGTRRFNDFVGLSDTNDYYKFEVTTPINFQVFMDGLAADADIRLYRDENRDNQISSGELVRTLTNNGTNSELTTESLSTGRYFLQVYPSSESENTNYKLQVSNLTSETTELGVLTGTQNFSGFLNPENLRDDYRFSLTEAKTFTLSLTNLTDDADVQLYQDGNGNGIIDFGESIRTLTNNGANSESATINLAIGNYWVEVYTGQAGTSTGYNLTVSA